MERNLSDENSNPNALGTQTGADGQAQAQSPAPNQVGPEQFAGLQHRINELTARAHEAERRRDSETQELRQMNQQLLLAMASGQAQAQAPQVEIEPDERKKYEAFMAPQLAALRAQQDSFLAQSMQMQLESVVKGQHPEVERRARAIFADAISKGAHKTGFNPVAALTYAKGELADVLLAAATQNAQVAQGQNFNRQSQTLTSQSVVVPNAANQQVAEPDLDDDPEKASAFYAQRLGNKAF